MPALFVSPSDPIHVDRDLGRRLASHLSRLSNPQQAVIQALLADLLADDQTFLAPVRDLTGRASFLPLLARIGSGAGQLERDALLQTLEPTYSRVVLDRLAAFLDGLLNLPETEQAVVMRPPVAAVAKVSPSRPTSSPELAPPVQPLPARSAFVAPTTTAPTTASSSRPLVRRLALVAIFGVTAGLTAATVLLLRSGVLCGLSAGLPFCPAEPTAGQDKGGTQTPEGAINAGLQAARDLATAGDLISFQRALEQLEANVVPLSSSTIPQALMQQRDGLEAIIRTGRERLRQEQFDRHRLELAREARDLASRQSDIKALSAVDEAISQLQAISSGSFSERDARSLLRDLEAAKVRLVQASTPETPAAPPDPDLNSPTPDSPGSPNGGAAPGSAGGNASNGQKPEPLF